MKRIGMTTAAALLAAALALAGCDMSGAEGPQGGTAATYIGNAIIASGTAASLEAAFAATAVGSAVPGAVILNAGSVEGVVPEGRELRLAQSASIGAAGLELKAGAVVKIIDDNVTLTADWIVGGALTADPAASIALGLVDGADGIARPARNALLLLPHVAGAFPAIATGSEDTYQTITAGTVAGPGLTVAASSYQQASGAIPVAISAANLETIVLAVPAGTTLAAGSLGGTLTPAMIPGTAAAPGGLVLYGSTSATLDEAFVLPEGKTLAIAAGTVDISSTPILNENSDQGLSGLGTIKATFEEAIPYASGISYDGGTYKVPDGASADDVKAGIAALAVDYVRLDNASIALATGLMVTQAGVPYATNVKLFSTKTAFVGTPTYSAIPGLDTSGLSAAEGVVYFTLAGYADGAYSAASPLGSVVGNNKLVSGVTLTNRGVTRALSTDPSIVFVLVALAP